VAQPTGHPLGTVFLLKYGPQAQELQEGVAFHGRAADPARRVGWIELRGRLLEAGGNTCSRP